MLFSKLFKNNTVDYASTVMNKMRKRDVTYRTITGNYAA